MVRFEFIKLQQISTPIPGNTFYVIDRNINQSTIRSFFAIFVICLPTQYLEVLKNSFRRVCASQIMRWNLEVLVIEEGRKPECQGEKALGAKDRTTTKSSHTWCQRWDLNAGHISGLNLFHY